MVDAYTDALRYRHSHTDTHTHMHRHVDTYIYTHIHRHPNRATLIHRHTNTHGKCPWTGEPAGAFKQANSHMPADLKEALARLGQPYIVWVSPATSTALDSSPPCLPAQVPYCLWELLLKVTFSEGPFPDGPALRFTPRTAFLKTWQAQCACPDSSCCPRTSRASLLGLLICTCQDVMSTPWTCVLSPPREWGPCSITGLILALQEAPLPSPMLQPELADPTGQVLTASSCSLRAASGEILVASGPASSSSCQILQPEHLKAVAPWYILISAGCIFPFCSLWKVPLLFLLILYKFQSQVLKFHKHVFGISIRIELHLEFHLRRTDIFIIYQHLFRSSSIFFRNDYWFALKFLNIFFGLVPGTFWFCCILLSGSLFILCLTLMVYRNAVELFTLIKGSDMSKLLIVLTIKNIYSCLWESLSAKGYVVAEKHVWKPII